MITELKNKSSFRDPSGFIFRDGGEIFRQVNLFYREDYDRLMGSGLYERLAKSDMLIRHEEVAWASHERTSCYKVIRPEKVPFVSYPYEWCFSQLRDAALLTLRVQKTALEFGMSLKDGSAYNVQFFGGKPVFIDTLSFERYVEGSPWQGYRQFCQHFLAPLALMDLIDLRMGQITKLFIDGVPLDMASRLLPFRSKLSFTLLSHIHLHAKSQDAFSDRKIDTKKMKLSRLAFTGIIENMLGYLEGLRLKTRRTVWGDYYSDTNYTASSFEHKKQAVGKYIQKIMPSSVWDLGANEGVFSRLASKEGIFTISFDMDPLAVEKNYAECVRDGERNMLPLVLDLANPSPGLGWANEERDPFVARGPAEMVLALALVHHLAISNNVPFVRMAELLSALCRWLVIEFVPKQDSQVQRLLRNRTDIFSSYDIASFEGAFRKYFDIEERCGIAGSERTLYLMKRKETV